MKLVYRSGRIVIVLALIAASVGCVSGGRSFRSPQLEDARRQARSVAVVPAVYAPKVVYDIVSPGAPMSPGDVLLTATSIITALVVGAHRVYSAPLGKLPEEQTAKIFAPLRKSIADQGIMLDDPSISASLADQIVISAAGLTDSIVSIARDAGPLTSSSELNLSGLSARNVDLAIVVRINDLGFLGLAMPLEAEEGEETTKERTADETLFLPVESDPMIRFGISAVATAVSVRDGNELLREPLILFSKPRRVSEWVQHPAAVKQEMARVYANSSQRIVENLFLLYDLKPDNVSASWEHCVMELREPGMSAHPFNINKWKEYYVSEFGAANMLQPILKWEAFPRYKDREEGPKGHVERISDVTYDLKIWKGSVTDPVYERAGLKAIETWKETMVSPVRITTSGQEQLPPRLRREGIAEHKIEVPLEQASEYFWSVRARFKMDGKVRVTMWSRFKYPNELDNCEQNVIRAGLHYRFRTPQVGTVK